jgi:hypothetical protein
MMHVNFIDGANDLVKVVAGTFIEDYLIRDLFSREETLARYGSVVVLFVNLEQSTYKAAASEYTLSHLGRRFTGGPDSNPGYVIDLAELEALPLIEDAAR